MSYTQSGRAVSLRTERFGADRLIIQENHSILVLRENFGLIEVPNTVAPEVSGGRYKMFSKFDL